MYAVARTEHKGTDDVDRPLNQLSSIFYLFFYDFRVIALPLYFFKQSHDHGNWLFIMASFCSGDRCYSTFLPWVVHTSILLYQYAVTHGTSTILCQVVAFYKDISSDEFNQRFSICKPPSLNKYSPYLFTPRLSLDPSYPVQTDSSY